MFSKVLQNHATYVNNFLWETGPSGTSNKPLRIWPKSLALIEQYSGTVHFDENFNFNIVDTKLACCRCSEITTCTATTLFKAQAIVWKVRGITSSLDVSKYSLEFRTEWTEWNKQIPSTTRLADFNKMFRSSTYSNGIACFCRKLFEFNYQYTCDTKSSTLKYCITKENMSLNCSKFKLLTAKKSTHLHNNIYIKMQDCNECWHQQKSLE